MGDCWFEDLDIGATAVSRPYDVAEEEIIAFARQFDPRPFHVDRDAAAASIFGGITASSAHIFSIATRLTIELAPWFRVLAAMGFDETRFPNPVRPNDRLVFTIRVDNKRISQSRTDRGIVHCIGTLCNHKHEIVMERGATLLVARRP